VATAAGLYALDAATGDEVWVYPTVMPLGHSPTVAGGVVYVGGFDRMIHAIDAQTGQGLWTFTAISGFQINPLVVNNVVNVGSRVGVM
jgi:outer membrane protein assembly factor BamB